MARALEEGGLPAGRAAVARIVGRDPESLDAAGVARAAVESLAENFSDGVVAPVFWMALAGLPGGGGLQGDQHRRQHDRAPDASGTAPSAGRRRGSTIWSTCRRRGWRRCCWSAAACLLPGASPRGALAGGAAGRAAAPLAERRLAGGGDGGGARVRAGGAAALRRGAGRGRGDGARAGGAISGPRDIRRALRLYWIADALLIAVLAAVALVIWRG